MRKLGCALFGHIWFEVGEEYSHNKVITSRSSIAGEGLYSEDIPYYNQILKCSKCGLVKKKSFNRCIDEATRRNPTDAERRDYYKSGEW